MSYARHMETHKTPLHKLRAGTDRLPERKRAGKTAMRPLRIGHGQQAYQPQA